MNDWLADLKEAKKRAIAETQTEKSPDRAIHGSSEERLGLEQERISNLLTITRVEPILQEFVEEIIRGHPWFPSSSLNRTVTSKQEGSDSTIKEPPPWTGSVKGNPLPPELNLSAGRHVTRIEWNLSLTYRPPQQISLQELWIPVSLSAQGARVNGEDLAEETAAGMQAALKNSFEQVIKAAQTHHSHTRRHHRRWYKRLWRRLNYKGRAKQVILILALILAALLIGWFSMRSNDIFRGPRRMVQTERPVIGELVLVAYESNIVT